MACCSDATTNQATAAHSAAMHVNYTKGMVLGVDDFTQEFAYLAGRDQRAVRELAGYGTISGLAVTVEDTADGPRVRIAGGSAATSAGRLVCVPADQCGLFNAWLGQPDNAAQVSRLLGHGSPPLPPPAVSPPPLLTLWLALCWSDCLTAPVPIPGEPCRSEDSLMAPSRIADDFRLRLGTDPPAQVEEDALWDFVRWLRHVPVADTSPPVEHEADWIAALRAAAAPWLTAASPPVTAATLSDYMFDSPPPAIVVPRQAFPDFLRVAFRFWTTELRPLWSAPHCADPAGSDADCILLARIEVPVIWVGGVPTGAWQVAGNASSIQVDERRRPFLLSSRMLREWLLANAQPAADGFAQTLPQPLSPVDVPRFGGLVTSGAVRIAFATTGVNLLLGPAHHCVVCTAPVTLTLPKAAPELRGRTYVAKAATGASTLAAAAGDTMEGAPARALAAGTATTVICDGTATWYVIGSGSAA